MKREWPQGSSLVSLRGMIYICFPPQCRRNMTSLHFNYRKNLQESQSLSIISIITGLTQLGGGATTAPIRQSTICLFTCLFTPVCPPVCSP